MSEEEVRRLLAKMDEEFAELKAVLGQTNAGQRSSIKPTEDSTMAA